MKKLSLILSLILFLSSLSAQKYIWKEANSAGYTYKFVSNDPTQSRFYTLKNGLTVVLSVNKDEPRLQTIIATKAGSVQDPADHTGLAHYLEHLLFKGTDKYGSKDWAKEKPLIDQIENLYELYNHTKDEKERTKIYHVIDSVSGLAATYSIANEYDKMMSAIGAKGTNAFTDFEQTAYINDIPGNQVDRWIKIEAERFRNPVLRIFHTELEAVYEEKNISLDSDDNKVYEALFSGLFSKHNYGLQTTIGTIDHLKNPSIKAISNFYKTYYVPNNMVIIMAGDINPDSVIQKLDVAFGYMKPKPVAPYTFVPEDPLTKPKRITVNGPDAEYLMMAYRFPGANTKDALMLDFMSTVLSNGTAGLLDLNLVLKQKVLEASAGSYALKDYSILFVEGKAQQGQSLEDVESRMREQVENLATGNFDESVLKAIINNYKLNLIKEYESNPGRAFSILNVITSNQDWSSVLNKLDAMSQLTKADVMDFAKRNLGENYVAVYKRVGKPEDAQKVDKPEITPVSVNRDDQSAFVKQILEMPSSEIKPVFVDFNKDMQKSQLGPVEVLSTPNNTNALFELYYVYNMGIRNNKLLPIALQYVSYLGTNTMSAEDIQKKWYSLASTFNVNASDDQVYVSVSGLHENFTESVSLLEDLLKDAKPDPEVLRILKMDLFKQRADNKLNKDVINYNGLVSYARYGEKNPFSDAISDSAIEAVTSDQLLALVRALNEYEHRVLYYGPNSSSDLTPILQALHKVPTKLKTAPPAVTYTYRQNAENQVYYAHYEGLKQAQITWNRNAADFDLKLFPLASLYNEYFGNGMSALVFQTIRESKALAYSTFSSFSLPNKKEDKFTILSFVGTQADKFKDAVMAMNELHNELPLTEKLFNTAKQSLKQQIASTRVLRSKILFSYLGALKRGIDYDLRSKTYEALNSFTLEDLKKFHAQYYAKKPFTITVLTDKTQVKPEQMSAFGKVKEVNLKEIFGY